MSDPNKLGLPSIKLGLPEKLMIGGIAVGTALGLIGAPQDVGAKVEHVLHGGDTYQASTPVPGDRDALIQAAEDTIQHNQDSHDLPH